MNAANPLQLDNNFIRHLPGDPELRNFRRQVSNACWSKAQPLQFPQAKLLAWSQPLAQQLGLDRATLGDERLARIFSGTELLPGSEPYAMCYGGHQFGNWAGQLGDGRAINLGELKDTRGQHQVLQLKGAGPTPYSRTADGLAVLRSSLREYLCSEAMHHLGIPTTRALSLVTTGETVIRDMFYDGNPRAEAGAVVCRVAPSFLRFGSFEIFTARNELVPLKQLVDYTI
ncbi:MAG: protein adenylyltransferase SelO family protein, partial [Pseudomonadota bacterium]